MSSADTYRNPFSDYNANTMDTKQIVDFWQSPFENNLLGITEEEVSSEKTAIIFMGGRGTGKTMLLKHFSFDAQRVRSENEKKDLKSYIQQSGCIGFYIRFDSPLLRSFDGLGITPVQWDTIFTHFFELVVCKAYVDALINLHKYNAINDNEIKNIKDGLINLLSIQAYSIESLEQISYYLIDKINYVNTYRANSAFSKQEFNPNPIHTFCQLTHGVAEIINKNCVDFESVNNLILIDEYENFLPMQQKIVNSAIKLSKDNKVAFRIGMRVEGFHTYDTVSNNEFIKELRDYRKILFENHLINKDNNNNYANFLKRIAKKRLNSIPVFSEKSLTDIEMFLGKNEDPEQEALEIVKGRDLHIEDYLKEIKRYYRSKEKKDFIISNEDLSLLKCAENPLYEMQNMRLLLKPYSIEWVKKAYNDYLNNVNSEEAAKYKNDYSNKYKLSYVFVLCSIYKTDKLYYSFKNYCYLSSGIVGFFLELCRCAFQYAYFEDKEALLEGAISKKMQSKAALDVANSELEQINKISKVGSRIYCFTKNVGNMLSKLHTDRRISYPETTQFNIDSSQITKNSETDRTFRAAIMWSVVQKKRGLQQASIGVNNDDIYILNRIFSPVFGISLRTRGGYNKQFTEKDLEELMSVAKHSVTVNECGTILQKKVVVPRKAEGQMSFFDGILGDSDE